MTTRAFIIHLARATARAPQVARILAACPLDAEVLGAVDGHALSSAEQAAAQRRHLHRPRYPFALGAGEIGCFLSHRKAWKAIVDGGFAAGLIIEDDVELEPGIFTRALRLALAHVAHHGVIQFQVRSIGNPGPVIARSTGALLARPPVVPLRTSCGLYSRAAAQRLLELTATFDRPIDSMMQMRWVTGLLPLIAVPSGVSEISGALGGTTIQKKHMPLQARLRRELLRPLYRGRIRWYSHHSRKALGDE